MFEYSLNLLFATAFGLVGLAMGSFAGAMVWRLRAIQLREDEKAGEKISKKDLAEISSLKKTKAVKDRSVCLHCGHTLAWYDLVPLLSWLRLGGKCRYCHKHIGWTEPVMEVAVALFFVVSYYFWPYQLDTWWTIVQFACWLIAGVGLSILFVYDSKWFLLPNRITFVLIAMGAVYSLASFYGQADVSLQIFNIALAVMILSGLYYVIYVVSKHQWVGFGDIKLGLALALLLADWKLALLALFLANAIGTLVLMPMILGGRIKRRAHVPFGPFLIAGWFFAGIFGTQIIDWYVLFTLGTV